MEIDRRKKCVESGVTDVERWSNPAALEAAWEARSVVAAQFIPAGTRVLDIGCGAMTLERHLPQGCVYQPCDVVARDARTLVCDLNQGPLPDAALTACDRVTLLGVVEYLNDPAACLSQAARAGKSVLMSYCAADWTAELDRRALGWVNDFTLEQLATLVRRCGFSIRRIERIDAIQAVLLLEPGAHNVPATKQVLVLSYANVGNFGDRLGAHVLQSILPAHAVVTHAFFQPWHIPENNYDLLILGLGNSLFAPLLTPDLLALLDRIPRKIGIFGTQYRTGFSSARLHEVIDRLDIWHARYQDDVLLYGRNRNNVRHLGDWLVDAFSLTRGMHPEPLVIGTEIQGNLPLDRSISHIQAHRNVFSTRLHPLLCALCSAEAVAYREQHEMHGAGPSGKFRSMLMDVFGRTFPEETFWPVDKRAVLTYKTQVNANIQSLKLTIDTLLR